LWELDLLDISWRSPDIEEKSDIFGVGKN